MGCPVLWTGGSGVDGADVIHIIIVAGRGSIGGRVGCMHVHVIVIIALVICHSHRRTVHRIMGLRQWVLRLHDGKTRMVHIGGTPVPA